MDDRGTQEAEENIIADLDIHIRDYNIPFDLKRVVGELSIQAEFSDYPVSYPFPAVVYRNEPYHLWISTARENDKKIYCFVATIKDLKTGLIPGLNSDLLKGRANLVLEGLEKRVTLPIRGNYEPIKIEVDALPIGSYIAWLEPIKP